MSGIVFFRTENLEALRDFYINRAGCELWRDQGACVILRHGGFLFGFCRGEKAETEGVITLFYDRRDKVDEMFERLSDRAEAAPRVNEEFRIYHFFTRDPEGRALEFQHFEHPVRRHLVGDELLLTRRSVREYQEREVEAETLAAVMELCRFAPTARNSQPYYYKLIRDPKQRAALAGIRGSSSAPIGRAPLAVAICSDPEVSRRHIQDGCIGAYHLVLAAWHHGLGTCWIGDMDRLEAKRLLGIPEAHYLVTVTPLGYPKTLPLPVPQRKGLDWFVRE